MDTSVLLLGGLLVAVLVWALVFRDGSKRDPVVWTDVSLTQLQLHHKMTLAIADRIHLDPSCRELLRHQVALLKSVGVVGTKEESIDITPPTVAELAAHGPRADGGAPLIARPTFRRVDVDAVNRARGYRVGGDAESEGWGEYPRENDDD
jgi:hypothetical protein